MKLVQHIMIQSIDADQRLDRFLKRFFRFFGPSWCHLGAMFALLGPILAASWPILGLSWPTLAPQKSPQTYGLISSLSQIPRNRKNTQNKILAGTELFGCFCGTGRGVFLIVAKKSSSLTRNRKRLVLCAIISTEIRKNGF